MTISGALLTGFIAAIAIFAISWKAGGVWIRKHIPLPEDYPGGADAEAAMIAEFERIRKAHEASRRAAINEAHRADRLNFDDCA